ncbi:MAG: glycine dehydrogenase, partial [Nitrososphaerota archaeon]|nr:glycine dehydrogenase [Nitrososphaerota archaeon]
YLENPNFFGVIESKVFEIADAIHSKGGLFIVGVDPLSLGLLKPPGEYGADIVVGEGQPLGLHMNYGGPLLGIFACKGDQNLIRQMPGRIIGMTTSKDGTRRGYCMVLQTREQHIRRENATSNICTNEALCAIAAAVYLSLLGSEGLRELSKLIMYNSHYASKLLSEIRGIKSPYFTSTFFKDFTLGITKDGVSAEELHKRLVEYRILGGLPLSRYYEELSNVALFSVTEIHTKEDIQRLVDAVGKVVS